MSVYDPEEKKITNIPLPGGVVRKRLRPYRDVERHNIQEDVSDAMTLIEQEFCKAQ